MLNIFENHIILKKPSYFLTGQVWMLIPIYIPIRVKHLMMKSPFGSPFRCSNASGGLGGSLSPWTSLRNRSFYIQVPTGLNRPAPLLIALHAQGFEADSPGPSKSGIRGVQLIRIDQKHCRWLGKPWWRVSLSIEVYHLLFLPEDITEKQLLLVFGWRVV